MVALGILGIGLLMVAAAFPVAIDQVRQGVELRTSQLVFDEAVTMLKTRITAAQLAAYMNTANNAGAYEGWYQLSPGKSELNPTPGIGYDPNICLNPIFTISFDTVDTDDPAAMGNAIQRTPVPADGTGDAFYFQNINCVYSDDDTYGWVAAAQAVTPTLYKFWIFVLRDPGGVKVMDGATERLKYQLLVRSLVNPRDATTASTNVVTTRKFTLGAWVRSGQSPMPQRSTFFLTDTGAAERIRDMLIPDDTTTRWDCIGSKNVWDITVSAAAWSGMSIDDRWKMILNHPDVVVNRIACVGENPDVGVAIQQTRGDPTIAVYETVIDYSMVQ